MAVFEYFSSSPKKMSSQASRSTYESLLTAIRDNDTYTFREIIEEEGLPRDDNWYDYELLIKAIKLNRKCIVMHFLNKRCRVNKPERLSQGTDTPLHLVAEKLGWSDVIEKMLQLKARVTDQNADGNTPLHLAFLKQRSNGVVDLLLENYTRNYIEQYSDDVVNNDGLGVMHIACTRSEIKSIKDFFDIGRVDILSQVSPSSDSMYAGYSCLHFAVEAGRYEIVRLLCEYEAEVYARDRNDTTPLHLALEKLDTKMIDILWYYDYRHDNYVNKFGMSHLMAACAGSDVEMVKHLYRVANESQGYFSLNETVNASEHALKGFTPLHFAAFFGRYETVNYLLENGAKCCTPTNAMITPGQLAAKNGHDKVANLIVDHCKSFCKVDKLVSDISSEITSEVAKIVLTN